MRQELLEEVMRCLKAAEPNSKTKELIQMFEMFLAPSKTTWVALFNLIDTDTVLSEEDARNLIDAYDDSSECLSNLKENIFILLGNME